jgi:hypothetical protein
MPIKHRLFSMALILIVEGVLNGAPVLDQQCLGSVIATPAHPTGGNSLEVPYTYSGTPPSILTGALAQTFTVGISGRLTKVDVLIDNFYSVGGVNTVTVLLTRTNNGIPIPQPLVARQIMVPFSKGYVWYSVTGFSIPVVSGDVLAITIHPDKYGIEWGCTYNANAYPQGQGYFISRTSSAPRDTNADFGFRTFVDQPIGGKLNQYKIIPPLYPKRR